MNDVLEYVEWAKGFSMSDDGVEAFLAIKKIREISAIMVARKEGWEEEVSAVLNR